MFEAGNQVGGRYEIQRRLGRGGMGTVYAAHDPILGRLVAIKVFAGDLDIPDARDRFTREARSAAKLAHPHIVAVYDFGEHEGQPYIVMEYVPGETLAEVIRRKAPVSMADKLRWVEELAAGVGYAHQLHVIHRDIKPANLVIDRTGRLRILDFGIARMLGIASHTKDMIGTPGYMAPEQILGGPVDRRADLFSVGVVFYELLSYTEAFPGDTLPTITHRILTQDPVPLPRLVPDLHRGVLPIIERLLKKNVDDRFDDAESLRKEVGRVRRHLEEESSTSVAAPTVIRRDTPVPVRGRPGTGSAKRPVSGMISVATPPPADPGEFARRRTTLLEAARTLMESGDLDMALAACQKALIYDEQHLGALELARQIKLARIERDAAALDEDIATTALHEIPGPAVAGPEYAPTVLAPPRRTPAPSATRPAAAPRPPTTAPPRTPPTPSLLARAGTAARTIPLRLSAAISAITARVRAVAPVVKARAGALVPTRLPFTRPAGRQAMLAWGAAGVILIAIIAAVVMVLMVPAAVPPAGIVVIDAVPWGTITEIQAENGESQPVPSPASTPLSLGLPAGTYQVLVAGPAPDSAPQRITVRVEPDTANVAPTVRFGGITPDEYFEQYLAAPPAPAETVPPPSETTAQGPAPR